ncbi:MAG: hypothetical protein E7652_01045 [Ruminococcaceae bacterium]|nr:hypothetical protein [Oscillospiraceae bacterium]
MNVRIKRILSFLMATIMFTGVLSASMILAAKDDTKVVDPLSGIYKYDKAQLEKLIGVDSYMNYIKDLEADGVKAVSPDTSIIVDYTNLVADSATMDEDGTWVYTPEYGYICADGSEPTEAEIEAYLADKAEPLDEEEQEPADETAESEAEEEEIREVITTTAPGTKIMVAGDTKAGDTNFDFVSEEDRVEADDIVVATGGDDETVFRFYVEKGGMYCLKLTYSTNPQESDDESLADAEISTTIERILYIDGKLPFSEARYLYFPRCWSYEYMTEDALDGKTLEEVYGDDGRFVVNDDGYIIDTEYDAYTFPMDKNGNDTRPRRWEVPMWQEYYVRDWLGYDKDPFQFYLDEGWHTITLGSSREEMIIKQLEFYGYEEEPTYKEWIAELKEEGKYNVVDDCEPIKVQAENPKYISVQNVIPGNDRTSSITEPQDPAVIKYNILDNGSNNNWMKYEVEVPETGLYNLAFRFRQNSLIGMFSSRRVKINGETQFKEASELRFMYNTEFQSSWANNGGDSKYMFYLEKGVNTVEIEIVLGEMENYVYQIEQIIDELNDVYQEMIQITGPIPDSNRDYNFQKLVPDCIVSIGDASQELHEIAESIVELTGAEGDQTNTLLTIAETLKLMAMSEYEIAPNFLTFKNYIIALSDWLYAALGQPVKLDYFLICDSKEELPQDVSNTAQKIWFECRAFVASFTMDYTTIGFSSDDAVKAKAEIEMWAIADRESMLITRYLVDNYFTPKTDIILRIKVITAGLQEAIIAGIGPDVSFLDTVNTITFGMRTAIEPVDKMDGFKDIMDEFSYEHVIEGKDITLEENPWYKKVSMYDETSNGEYRTYGIPTSLIMPMAFYRVDVLHELENVGLPSTWTDLIAAMPALLNGNLDCGISTGLPGAQLFIYQAQDEKTGENGDLFRDDGKESNLDDKTSLSAFKTLCELFQKYSCPVAYDITRFRTGEIPIMVSEDGITIYNTLMTYYELRGLWQMAPAIGTVRPDGTVSHNAVANTLAMIMPRDKKRSEEQKEAIWTYIKWYCGSESQQRQAREAIAVSLPTSKYSTANVEALLAQKWTAEEKEAIKGVLQNLVTVPEYPGSYILTQYVSFAFLNAYNQGQNPADALLEQVTYINKEITRKREEFGLKS